MLRMHSHLSLLSRLHELRFYESRIEQRIGKEMLTSTLSAQIVKVDEGPAETRVLIRPDPKVRPR